MNMATRPKVKQKKTKKKRKGKKHIQKYYNSMKTPQKNQELKEQSLQLRSSFL